MFKLHRHRSSDRAGERYDFRFSNFRAVQVPAVSDRLFLSIVSVDSGKTIAKSSKAASRSGICQWPDTILESIWFSKDEVSKEYEECQYKIIVSVGSTKSGILGEIFLNLSNFLNLVDPTAISLPLKRCNSGTVLQLKVQCLGTKSKLSGVRSLRDMSPRLEDRSPTPTNDDMDNRSDCSDSMFNRGVRSSSENHLGATYQDEPGNRETSFSASGSHRSSNSGDSTADRTNFSPRDNSNGGLYVGRQDSASSHASYVSAGRGDDGFRSNNSSFSSRASGPTVLQGSTPKTFANGLSQLSMGASDSSKDILEAAEETIEELRDEAKMWERHSRKLKADLELLKKECSEKSKQQAELAAELSAAQAEQDSYRHEIEELKSSLQDVNTRQTITGTPKRTNWIDLQKELEEEVKYLKESNADLTIQVNKTQEANIELLSILQELEETIEEQRVEISKISKVRQTADPQNGLLVKEDTEWAKKLSMKEGEIKMLREKLDHALNVGNAGGAGSNAIYLELEKENEILKAKIQELEKDCSELTDENLELIYKLKDKGQKLELHGHLTQKEQELDESKKRNFDFSKTVEFLETKLSSLQKDISSKEQSLLSELESIFQEHMEQEERINRVHFMLNKIENEKTLEVENLEREVISLTAQVSSTHEERENATLDAIRDVSVLRADKAKLEASLQDVSAQLRHYESQLEDLRKESKNKIKGLVDSLNASKQSEEMLAADAEHMKKLMEAAKSNEDMLRKASNELELKLKSSDYEKQQMLEEISGLNLQVQKMMNIQDEVFKLHSSLDEAKFQKGKLEELLHSVTEECEELKAQKAMLTDKISNMQESLKNGEEERRSRIAMQAKLVRLESDLSASEASHVHEAELKNELSRIKRSNSEYQRKLQSLEQENEDLTRRVQVMEKGFEKMPHIKEENLGNQETGGDDQTAIQSKIQVLESKLAEALEENKLYRAQQKSPMPEGQSAGGDGKEGNTDRVLQLEGELRDMKERLLNMSLQYAEVEAQRERLVMELKAVKKGRWF
ncbi:hypothetical protein PVAP13_9KG556900 [Panicum virgatum]|uniref:C2 NT-type domain-containing protein n=1 Tax=Panicum virgatum TaxID=38727 RepID=A0A8T0P3T7_PANVG|nr:hypothetical protein PVAP13_9KG556900 [Panicum virgatum]